MAKWEDEFPVTSPNWEAMTPGERLKEALGGAGGSKVVAEKSGVPLSTIGGYTRGGEMKLSNLRQLADATGVTVEWLATGRGPMRPGEPPAAPPPEPAKPQETAPPAPLPLFQTVNMDRLGAAYAAARTLLAQRGHHQPDPVHLVRIMTLVYDELTATEDPPAAP